MAIFLLDLSLRSAGHDYAPLWEAMRAAHAQRIMDTTWFVDVNQNVVDVTKALLSHVPTGDRILVLELVPGASWSGTGLDEETKAWLAQRVPVSRSGVTENAAEATASDAAPEPASPVRQGALSRPSAVDTPRRQRPAKASAETPAKRPRKAPAKSR